MKIKTPTTWHVVISGLRREDQAQAIADLLRRIQPYAVSVAPDFPHWEYRVAIALPEDGVPGQYSLALPPTARGRTNRVVDCGSYLGAVVSLTESLQALTPDEIHSYRVRIADRDAALNASFV